ncbi:MAG: glutamate synthase subunit alpha, partial [Verrucomicrobiota bacterium]
MKTAVPTTRPGKLPARQGLYDPAFEHDACGVGFIAHIKGKKSHQIVRDALQILLNLDHRGAVGCDPCTGDGAGILLQMPHKFFSKLCADAQIKLPEFGKYGAGMAYLPRDEEERGRCEKLFEKMVAEEGQTFLGWKDVATDNSTLGETGKAAEPFMRYIFIGRNPNLKTDLAFERKLYVIRKRAENAIRYTPEPEGDAFFVPSLSCKTFIYKGLFMPAQVDQYFVDLRDPDMESALALVHSRFSTNTFPT